MILKNDAWLSLIAAAIMEILWLFTLRLIKLTEINNIDWTCLRNNYKSLSPLLPLLGYILFGTLNVVFISYAMKTIPMSIAFSIWMSIALIGTVFIDAYYFKQSLTSIQLISLGMILIGIIILKNTSKSFIS